MPWPKLEIPKIRRRGSPVVGKSPVLVAAGDASRDSGDWQSAVAFYRLHLKAVPQDFPIQVQLGHAMKESGDLEGAREVYLSALAGHEQDSDLWLSLGHVSKLIGDQDQAVACYRKSAEIDKNSHAVDELARMGKGLFPPGQNSTHTEPVTLADVARGWAGVKLIRSHEVGLDRLGRELYCKSDDPWIQFELDRGVSINNELVVVEFYLTPLSPGYPASQYIYLDYGCGISEKTKIKIKSNQGVGFALIINPAELKSVRWDLDNKKNTMLSPTIKCVTIDQFRHGLSQRKIAEEVRTDIEARISLGLKFTEKGAHERVDSRAVTKALNSDSIDDQYTNWILLHEHVGANEFQIIKNRDENLKYKPSFSFIVPTYNTPVKYLCECIDALLNQTYPHFEICIADDCSTSTEMRSILRGYARHHDNIKLVERIKNGHISACSNSAIEISNGEFLVLVDHDDVIPPYALSVVAHYLEYHRAADILFSDEDKIDENGSRYDPYFKGRFNKFLMYGHNMVSHLGVYRRELVVSVGGFRLGLEGSQDYDLFLRCYERTSDENVIHIPHVLYHWRAIAGSTAVSADQKGYAVVAARDAINGHFERTGAPLRSIFGRDPGVTEVMCAVQPRDTVSVIIPTRDGVDLLKPCLESILRSEDPNIEIIVVDNQTKDKKTLSYLNSIQSVPGVRLLKYDHEFNFSDINNVAAKHAKGNILCFLNNDTEVISAEWLIRARTLLSMSDVGVVGARLLYPDGSLQHFGVIVGGGEHRVAAHAHFGLADAATGYFSKGRLLQEVSAVTAACLFVRRGVFLEVGGFESDLPVAYNDVDLCLKVRNAGYRIVCDPEIKLYHKESKTRGSDGGGRNRARLDVEAAWMRARWGEILDVGDPFYSPYHRLDRADHSLAPVPRADWPWRLLVPIR